MALMRKEGATVNSTILFCILASVLASVFLAIAAAAQESEEEAGGEVVLEEEIVAEESAGMTPDSPLYVFDKIVDNVQLALADGDEKTKKALEIKEERIAEASVMVDRKKPDEAKSALELATKAAEQAQKELDPELEKETNKKVRRAAKLLSGLQEKLPDEGWEGVEKAIDAQLSEEEKVRVALLVSKSRLSYCDSLAKQDFDLMKGDELCQIEKSPQWLKERVEGEFTAREDNAKRQIIDSVSTCIVDPKKCDCSQIPVSKHSQSCEVKKALAIRCEYENDQSACSELASEKMEDFLPDFIGEEGKQTVLAHLREKEQDMFSKFKPPECAAVSTFQDCFAVMKELYGEPPECEGLNDDECIELMKSKPPETEEERKKNFPPECQEAGVANPLDCAKLMFSKYGTPPQCEGLDTKECMKLMRQERPDAANFAMPPECQEAGAKEPRQCFDIMTAKFGTPPECEGLSSDDCFKEMMKRGPGQGGGKMRGQEPPECQEKGLKGQDCFKFMCGDKSPQECFEGKGMGGIPPNCVGLSPEECRSKMQEFNGMPPECAENPEKCREAFEGRGMPGGIPAECAGLEPSQCELVMMQKFGPIECREVSTKEECKSIIREKSEQAGTGGGLGGFPGPGGEGRFGAGGFGGGFVNECEGLAREECDKKMYERFAPPECQGLSHDECGRNMRGRFERERQEQDQNRMGCEGLPEEECRQKLGDRFREPGERREFEGSQGGGGGRPPDCQGLTDQECRNRFFEGRGEGEARGEGERREGEPGPQRAFREPLGAPIRGTPSGCEGLSPDECGRQIQERFGQQPMPQAGQLPQGEQAGRNEPMQRQFPNEQQRGQPGGDFPRDYPRGDSGGYPSGGGAEGGGGSEGSSGSDSGSGGSGGSGGGDGGSPPAGVTGQIVRAVKWIGGQ